MPNPRPQAEPEDAEPKRPLKLPNNLFPLGYKAGFTQWWAAISPAVAEAAVLNFLPFKKPLSALSPESGHSTPTTSPPKAEPHGPRECASNMIPLSGTNRIINEFTVTRTAESPSHHLVMLHGHGAGLAFFYRNYDMLSRRAGWKLWSLDLLGYGRSSRPPFSIKSKEPDAKITEAENWFIDALEEWRQIRNIDRFTLLGHSFGGYLAVRYALKYPTRVNKLILASPVGVPEDPYAVRADLPDALPQPQPRPYPKWLVCLWEANISPFSLVRWAGPLGPRLVSGWTSRRFSSLPEDESTALHDYAYSLFRQRGSGEYALAYVLAPGAYARHPLLWRVQELVAPSVWMYGEMDWMDIAGGYAAEEKIRATEQPQGLDPGWRGGKEWRGDRNGRGGEAKVLIVKKAGHHLYLDGWEEFNELVTEEMKDVEVREKQREKEAMKM